MRFALVNGQRRTAEKGLIGICPACGGPVLAKCGEKKAHHWAHKRQCSDTWATGKETDWHLDWKNCFPEAWQERILKDTQSGEKHIADILTEHNLVLEFQHSPIAPEERRAREYFYSQDGRRMVWVVDIREKKNDQKRCESYILSKDKINKAYFIQNPEECFPERWIASYFVPIIFDVKIWIPTDLEGGECEEFLPCLISLLFYGVKKYSYKLFRKKYFIELVKNGNFVNYIDRWYNKFYEYLCDKYKNNDPSQIQVPVYVGRRTASGWRLSYRKKYSRKGGTRKTGGRSRKH